MQIHVQMQTEGLSILIPFKSVQEPLQDPCARLASMMQNMCADTPNYLDVDAAWVLMRFRQCFFLRMIASCLGLTLFYLDTTSNASE